MRLAALALAAALLPTKAARLAAAPAETLPGATSPVAALPGWAGGDPRPALRAFRASCAAVTGSIKAAHAALPPPPGLAASCRAAASLEHSPDVARAKIFFESRFVARRVEGDAFFTGYFEPVVEGSLRRTADFATPLYAPPPARRLPDGTPAPLPDRAAIVAGALAQAPLVYVREPVEAFFIQVQGSARIRLRDGRLSRLAFAGRNGYPYTSIGKILVDRLHVPPAQMGMAQLEAWIRTNGQSADEAGGRLMQENRSYIFFRFEDGLAAGAGPVGGAGVSLTPLVSLAVDRTHWPYGLPMYVDAALPWRDETPTPFRRLMVAQDTGSAILGAARADIFFGTGPEAATRAGAVRDHGALWVLWPREGASR